MVLDLLLPKEVEATTASRATRCHPDARSKLLERSALVLEWDIYDSFTFVEFLVALFGVSILDRGFHDVMICLEIV